MKKLLFKWTYIFLSVALLLASMPGVAFAQRGKNMGAAKRFLVKFKEEIRDSRSKIEQKKKNKVIRGYRETRNSRVYIVELNTGGADILQNDQSIEVVEEDATVQLMEETWDPSLECTCCNDCGEGGCICECPGCVCEGEYVSCSCQEECEGCSCGGQCMDCGCSSEYGEKTAGTCSHEDGCTCVIGGPEQIIETLETGTDSMFSPMGDKIGWNISRIRANVLHEAGIYGDGVKVAVFDTGIDLENSDLNVAGGVSFVDGVTSYDDDNGHGTAMAGILASKLNGDGLVGVAPNIELYSVKVLDKYGIGNYSNVLQAVDWAIENDINIITMSFGGTQHSQILGEAIKRATDNNILVIAAAGNSGENRIFYPAAYPSVICVGSTDSNNSRASFSNRGEQMDVAAPGVDIQTTGLGNKLVTVDGTSASVQHVAGLAALLWGEDTNLTNGQIKFLLYKNAWDMGDQEGYGYGIINAEKAYENLQSGNYTIAVIDEHGHEMYIEGAVDVGEDGIFSIQTDCGCTGCYKGSSYYNYSEHNNTYGGHRRVYYCGLSSCRAIHLYVCVYGTSTYDKISGCCKCGNHTWSSSVGFEAYHVPGKGHRYYKTCTKAGCGATTYTGTYKTDYASCCLCVGHSWGSWSPGTPPSAHPHPQTRNCTRCSQTDQRTNILSSCCTCSGHSWGSWSPSPPPSSHPHTQTRSCTRCSQTDQRTNISGTCCSCGNHNFTSLYYKSTHPHPGYYRCSRSGCSAETPSGTYGWFSSCSSCHTHSYTTKVTSSTHTSNGHYYYWKCSCGKTSNSGYETLSTCASCTTPPSISFQNPMAGTSLSEADTAVQPVIVVQDNENDTLTCKYYIDSETTPRGTQTVSETSVAKTVTFTTAFNAATLSEGTHVLKAEASDGLSPTGTTTISFIVDKSAPIIGTVTVSSTSNSINVSGSATDGYSGMDAYPYRYTIGSQTTQWLTSGTYTSNPTLTPNTSYSIVFEARDKKGHIARYTSSRYTKAVMPSISVGNATSSSLEITATDSNPAATQYLIRCGTQYVSQSGALTSSQTWVTLTNRKIKVIGLAPNTGYTFYAKARNAAGELTDESQGATGTTLPLPPSTPTGLAAAYVTRTLIIMSWNAVPGATSYNIKIGETVHTSVTSSYSFTGLAPFTAYTFSVQACNAGGESGWSPPVSVVTLPDPPPVPTGLAAHVVIGTNTLTWEASSEASSYEVEINGSVAGSTTNTTYIHDEVSPDTQYTYRVQGRNTGGVSGWSSPLIVYSMPNLPVGATVSNVTNTSASIAWQANGNPSTVQYKVAAFDEHHMLVKENQWTYELQSVITGLSPMTEYLLRIKARNSQGAETDWQDIGSIQTLPNPPAVPTNLTAISKDTNVTIRWSAVDGADAYEVQRNGVIINSNIKSTEYTDTGLEPETAYLYAVRAKNAGGCSAWSAQINKKTLPSLPEVPENVVAMASNTSITVSWDPASGAKGYEILADNMIINAGTETTFVHNGLAPGTTHTYRVRARNEGGKSNWSPIITKTTIPGIPMVPANLQAIATDSEVILTWNAVEGASTYIIEADGIEVDGLVNTSYIHSMLEPSSSHYYRVKAVNAGGQSDWSTLLEVTTQTLPDDAPVISNIHATQTSISFEWSAIEGATAYEVEADGDIIDVGTNLSYEHDGLGENTVHTYRVRALTETETKPWSILLYSRTLPGMIQDVNSSATCNSIVFTWDAVPGVTGYIVEFDGMESDIGAIPSFVCTGLESNTSYTFRVKAVNMSGEGPWSEMINIKTQKEINYIPANIEAQASVDSISLSWDIVSKAIGYEIEIDGADLIYVTGAYYLHEGLQPATTYSYRIRSVVEDVYGSVTGEVYGSVDYEVYCDWSEVIAVNTLPCAPQTPVMGEVIVTGSSVTLIWEAVQNATGYEVETDGAIIQVGQTTTYIDSGMPGQSQHTYRVRAIGEGGVSPWSEEKVVMTLRGEPGVPINIIAETTLSEITLTWDEVTGATRYEVKDGETIIDNGPNTTYIMTGLSPGTIYTLQVRAVIDGIAGPWSGAISCTTDLAVPTGLNASIEGSGIVLVWNAVDGATAYDLEIDGVIVEDIANTSYSATDLLPGTRHSFRIRAKNGATMSDWSEPCSQKTPGCKKTFNCTAGEEFDVHLSGSGIRDFSNYVFTLEYDEAQLEVVDLHSPTHEKELTSGNIPGTHIRILDYSSGRIVFVLTEEVLLGREWLGIINTIRFRSKINGQATITYSIQ